MKTTKYVVECQEYDEAAWYRYDSYDTLEEAEATMSRTANIYAVRIIKSTLESVEIRKQVKHKPIDPKRLQDILKQDPVFSDGSEYIWRLSYMDCTNHVFKLIRNGGEMVADFEDVHLDGDWFVVQDRGANTRKFLVHIKQKFTI
jgi:hypothetical protein